MKCPLVLGYIILKKVHVKKLTVDDLWFVIQYLRTGKRGAMNLPIRVGITRSGIPVGEAIRCTKQGEGGVHGTLAEIQNSAGL